MNAPSLFLPAGRSILVLLLAIALGACSRGSYSFQFAPAPLAATPTAAPTFRRLPGTTETADTLMATVAIPAPVALSQPAQPVVRARPKLGAVRMALILTRVLPQLRQAQAAARHQPRLPDQPTPVRYRSRGIAFLLNLLPLFLLGVPGIYCFYLGRPERGVLQLALTGTALLLLIGGLIAALLNGGVGALLAIVLGALLYTGVLVWQLVDAILILSGDLKPKDGEYYPRFFQTRPDAEVPR